MRISLLESALLVCLLSILLMLALFLIVLVLLFQSLLFPLLRQLHLLLLLFPLQLPLLLLQFLSLLLLLPLELELQELLLLLLPSPLFFLLMVLLMRRIRRNSRLRHTTTCRGSAEIDTPVSLVPQRSLTRGGTHRGRKTAAVTGHQRVASCCSVAITAAASVTDPTQTTIPCVGIIGIEVPAERNTGRRPRRRHVFRGRGLLSLLLLLLCWQGSLSLLCWQLRLLHPASTIRRAHCLR